MGSAVMLRALPILAGLSVARAHGEGAYADFVLLVSFLNLAAAVIQLGIVPQILSNSLESQDGVLAVRLGVIGASAFAVCAYPLSTMVPHVMREPGVQSFAAGCVGGLVCASVSAAVLSRRYEYSKLLNQAGVFLLVTGTATIAVLLGNRLEVSLLFFAGSMIVLSGACWMYVTSSCVLGRWQRPFADRGTWKSVVARGVFSSLFGLATLLGFYVVNARTGSLDSGAGRGSIAIGLQLLAIVIFVPGALSPYLIPKLQAESSDAGVRRLIFKAMATYASLAVLVAGSCIVLLPAISLVWGFEMPKDGQLAFGLLMLAAVLAASNAALNQYFVSVRSFGLQAALACVWLTVVMSIMLPTDVTITMPGFALIVAYVVILLLGSVILVRRGLRAG